MRIFAQDHHNHPNPWDEAPPWAIELGFMASLLLRDMESIMIDTSRILAATTRATTDSASLRQLVKDVKASLDKSIADLAAAIANSDPVAMAKAQADIDQAAGLLDTDSTETEAALTANVTPTPTP